MADDDQNGRRKPNVSNFRVSLKLRLSQKYMDVFLRPVLNTYSSSCFLAQERRVFLDSEKQKGEGKGGREQKKYFSYAKISFCVFCRIFFCLSLYLLLDPCRLQAQVLHKPGYMLRALVGQGLGQISDTQAETASGTAWRLSLDAGAFLYENFAAHAGLDYTHAPSVKFHGKSTEHRTEGSYFYTAATMGLSYYFTHINVYVSLLGRLHLASRYRLKLLDPLEDSHVVVLRRKAFTGRFERGLGGALLVGTEEWFVYKNTGLGLTLVLSGDRGRSHRYLGLALSLTYH